MTIAQLRDDVSPSDNLSRGRLLLPLGRRKATARRPPSPPNSASTLRQNPVPGGGVRGVRFSCSPIKQRKPERRTERTPPPEALSASPGRALVLLEGRTQCSQVQPLVTPLEAALATLAGIPPGPPAPRPAGRYGRGSLPLPLRGRLARGGNRSGCGRIRRWQTGSGANGITHPDDMSHELLMGLRARLRSSG